MNSNQLISVGKVREAHGLKGEIFAILFAKEAPWINDVKELTLVRREKDNQGSLKESEHLFSIKKHKVHKVGLLLKLEGLDDRTEAESFEGSLLRIPAVHFTSSRGEKIYLREVDGFQVEDSKLGAVGKVVDFSSNGAQDLLVIEKNEVRFEVPFVVQTVVGIDWLNKSIRMDIPEGLFEV